MSTDDQEGHHAEKKVLLSYWAHSEIKNVSRQYANNVYFSATEICHLHDWDLTPKEAIALQCPLVTRLKFPPLGREIRWVAGVDVSYSRGDPILFAAVVVLDLVAVDVVGGASEAAQQPFLMFPGWAGDCSSA